MLRDGRVLQWWTDLERTVESFAEFSKRDAASLGRLSQVEVLDVEMIEKAKLR